ncbi:hypothetical protein EQZ23_18090 [Sphingomonas sp. UV9]|nr:hypothetical protein EQZ23_18090 [Sphingomonas sp. UV9]
MISAAPTEASKDTTLTVTKPCSANREQVAYPIEVARMMGLDTAAGLFGKIRLADELCITVRNLNYKINGERGASDADVVAAARGLEQRAERLLAHAQKLRAVVSPAVSDAVTAARLRQASTVLAHCDHVERFAYERQGVGLDAIEREDTPSCFSQYALCE